MGMGIICLPDRSAGGDNLDWDGVGDEDTTVVDRRMMGEDGNGDDDEDGDGGWT